MNPELKYDVVVAGAGVAGIAAAVAAARRGMKTALIEKQTIIGGLATSGLIFVYLPLCDGKGTQVTFGISEELLRRSINYGPYDLPEEWGGPVGGKAYPSRLATYFNPAGFTLELDKILKEAGVELFLETMVVDAEKDCSDAVKSITVANASGMFKIAGCRFIDTTGDASLLRRAGGEYETGVNFVSPWWIENAPGATRYHIIDDLHIEPILPIEAQPKAENPETGECATWFSRTAWELIRNRYEKLYKDDPEQRRKFFPVHLPAMPQFRKIAAAKCVTMLESGQQNQHLDTSVGLYGDWRRSGWVWETPYGTLLPEKTNGMLVAGRCMGAIGDAWEAFRVIPSAAMTGEIAGVAAALSIDKKCDPKELEIENLRGELRKSNFRFHLEEVGLEAGK